MDTNSRPERSSERFDAVGPTTDGSTQRHDCLTGFGDRGTLIAELTDVLEPGSPASVLAVFEHATSDTVENDLPLKENGLGAGGWRLIFASGGLRWESYVSMQGV